MSKFQVKQVAILGAGVMGAQIAAHLVNVGVPVVLGTGGVEKIIELELLPTERAALDKSIAAVKELVATMNRLTASA